MRVLLPLLILIGLSACEPTVAVRGMILDQDKINEIAVGSSREDVAAKLGSPTFVSTFDTKKWYYVGQRTEQVAFYNPDLVEQKGLVVSFSDDGKVTSITPIDPTQVANIDPVERKTPTYGQDNTLIQQLLGNLSRPMPSGIKKNH